MTAKPHRKTRVHYPTAVLGPTTRYSDRPSCYFSTKARYSDLNVFPHNRKARKLAKASQSSNVAVVRSPHLSLCIAFVSTFRFFSTSVSSFTNAFNGSQAPYVSTNTSRQDEDSLSNQLKELGFTRYATPDCQRNNSITVIQNIKRLEGTSF